VAGEVVQLMDEDGNIIGVAKAKMRVQDVKAHMKERNVVAAHADDIVMF
jgi:glutamate 5-kinase